MQQRPDSSGERHTDPWGWTTDAAGNPIPPPATSAAAPVAAAAAEDHSEGEGGAARPRSRAHGSGGWGSSRRLALIGAGAAVLLGGIGVGGYVLASSKPAKKAASHTTLPNRPAPTTSVVPVTVPIHHVATCPLTGLPAPGGVVPQRPVLAVKVGNDPNARPQSGLENADIVFDTLAEGGITRYIAVYQCGSSPDIGPIRSVRWDDWHILQMFGRADLAFVHGIDPDVNTVASIGWICDLDAFSHYGDYHTNPQRYAPEATYTATAPLWASCPRGPAPPAIFHFSAAPPVTAGPVASVELNYSFDADIVWRWSAAHHAFLHFYREGGAILADVDDLGTQLQATNVVIELVTLQYGNQAESPGGTGDVESQTVGSGLAYVLRGGRVERGTWSRPAWEDITTLTAADGKPMTLAPGQTWVEIVPETDAVTFTP